VHLAALQVPFCRADPPLGARVNVVGTVNVFEAASKRKLSHVVYASSIAVFDAAGTLSGHPETQYGVYKRDNESTAAVFFAESGVSSIGLRPHTVYGVGRDQGLTSAPTVASSGQMGWAKLTCAASPLPKNVLMRNCVRSKN